MLSNQTDAEVWKALCAGDLLALGIFYDRYGSIVYRLALRMLGNTQEAEDLSQEIFMMLWRNHSYNPQRGSMNAYLTTLTRSRAIDRHRQMKSQRQLIEKWSRSIPLENRTNLMDKISFREIGDRVKEALNKLPTQHRQVLEKAYFDGLSQSEISEDLKMPLGTVKTYKRKGLIQLRQILNDLVENRW